MVLKKIGATLLPKQMPPERLLGTPGISSPKNHKTEFVADLRDEPVPTTSPIKATGRPRAFSSSIWVIGPVTPCSSGCMPSRVILNMARACKGISGRDQASCAGLRSSVLISPVALKTATVMLSGTASLAVNHSASAHDCITALALALPLSAFSATSWKASKTSNVLFNSSAAWPASSASSSRATNVATLYPPCILPSRVTAALRSIIGEEASPLTRALKKLALT